LAEIDEAKEDPAPVVEEAAGDDWGSGWGTARTKKKGKKATEPEPPKVESKVEEPAPAEDEWAFGSSKKDKKKKGKNAVEEPKVSGVQIFWNLSHLFFGNLAPSKFVFFFFPVIHSFCLDRTKISLSISFLYYIFSYICSSQILYII